VFAVPDDVILNTRRAFSVSTTNPNGYSDLGAPRAVVLLAPWFTRFDIGLTKRIRFGPNSSIEFRGDVLNVFNNINFSVVDESRTPGSGGGIFQTDEAYRDLDNTYDPGGRLGQLAIHSIGDVELRRRCSSQPTSREPRTPQARDEVRTAPHQVPNQTGAVVLDHQDDRPLIEGEMIARDPTMLRTRYRKGRVETAHEPVLIFHVRVSFLAVPERREHDLRCERQ